MKQKMNAHDRLIPGEGDDLSSSGHLLHAASTLPENGESTLSSNGKALLRKVKQKGKEGWTSLVSKALGAEKTDGSKNGCSSHSGPTDLPTFPKSQFETLPPILQKVVAVADSPEERDMLLLGSLVSFGACLPGYHGYYDGKKVYPHLFLFISGQASAGKGRLTFCKQLVQPVHASLRHKCQLMTTKYGADLHQYFLLKGKNGDIRRPVKPPELMLFIPANNSATGVFQLVHDNEGRGLIFETEGDTLAHAFKSDQGNYSDGLRKAFQHENISYYRRTCREFAEIVSPCIAAVMSGTPGQIANLIPSAENGLFSRFIFYHMNIRPVWKNVFASNGHKKLEPYFDHLGQEFFLLYKALGKKTAIEFSLSDQQQDHFNAFFTRIQEKYMTLLGIDYMATIRRLGLIAFRLAMTLTALRMLETKDYSPQQECAEIDFQAALSMISVLVRHSSHVFSELPGDTRPARPKDKKEQFLERLPVKFNHKEFVTLAKSISILERTAKRYILEFCDKGLIQRENHGTYVNLTVEKADVAKNSQKQ